MRIAKLNHIFPRQPRRPVFQQLRRHPLQIPHAPVETSGAEGAELKGAARDDDTINKPEEEDSTCFEEF